MKKKKKKKTEKMRKRKKEKIFNYCSMVFNIVILVNVHKRESRIICQPNGIQGSP